MPTKDFIGYEITKMVPYTINRHFLRKRIPKPPPIIAKADRSTKPDEP